MAGGRAMTREERKLAHAWAASVAAFWLLRPLWLALAPHLWSCRFRDLTGMPCPTCGATRAVVAILNADLGLALASNPLFAMTFFVMLIGGPLASFWAWRRGTLPAVSRRWRLPALLVVIAATIVNWLYVVISS